MEEKKRRDMEALRQKNKEKQQQPVQQRKPHRPAVKSGDALKKPAPATTGQSAGDH